MLLSIKSESEGTNETGHIGATNYKRKSIQNTNRNLCQRYAYKFRAIAYKAGENKLEYKKPFHLDSD